jgi:hypothetical protein
MRKIFLCSLLVILGVIVVLCVLFGIKEVFFAIVTGLGYLSLFLLLVVSLFALFPSSYDEKDYEDDDR